MNFSEQLDKFVERGAEKHYGTFAECAYKDCGNALKPIVLKLVEALERLSQTCGKRSEISDKHGWKFAMADAAKEALAEVSQMLEGGGV